MKQTILMSVKKILSSIIVLCAILGASTLTGCKSNKSADLTSLAPKLSLKRARRRSWTTAAKGL